MSYVFCGLFLLVLCTVHTHIHPMFIIWVIWCERAKGLKSLSVRSGTISTLFKYTKKLPQENAHNAIIWHVHCFWYLFLGHCILCVHFGYVSFASLCVLLIYFLAHLIFFRFSFPYFFLSCTGILFLLQETNDLRKKKRERDWEREIEERRQI